MKLRLLSLAVLPLFVPTLLAQGSPEVEPNNVAADSGVFTLGLGTQGEGSVGVSGDVDFYKITLTSASDLRVWTNPGFTGALSDTLVDVYAADGTTLLGSDDDGGVGLYSLLVLGNLAAGDYYVVVRGFSTNVGNYTFDVVAAAPGTYVAVAPPLANIAEAPESNDPRPTFGAGVATASQVFSLNAGNLSAAGGSTTSFTFATADYDWYAFTVTTTGNHTFETILGAPSPATTDTVVGLFDSSLTFLASDDDGGAGNLSLLTYNITTPGTYYAVVKAWGTSIGNFSLRILGPLPPVPTGTATVTAQVGGCSGATLGVAAPGTEVPVLGSAFYLTGSGMDANTPAFRVLGLTTGPAFDLGSVGGPALCLIEVAPLSSVFVLTDGVGNDNWLISTPVSVAYIGLPLEQQIVALDSVDLIVATNRVSSVCGIKN